MAVLTCSVPPAPRTPRVCRYYHRSAFLGVLIVLAAAWPSATPAARAQGLVASEYQAKAAFLVNFPKYVDWPAEAFAETNSPIVIAVVGETRITGELENIIVDRTVNGRKIVLQQLDSGAVPRDCHILFISAAAQPRAADVLAQLKGASILTVGESEDFLGQGGSINLARRDQKIALEVNLAAADQARIKISSKLLNVASMVKGKAK